MLSYRLFQGFTKGHRVGGRDLAAHSVGVAASAAGTGGAIIATLAQSEAQLGRRVAAQARQAECQEGHSTPAGAGVSWGAGARSVGTVVLLICRAVVEQALHTAQAGAVLQDVFCRTQAALATGPTGGQITRGTALLALAVATTFTDEEMQAQVLIVSQSFAQRVGFQVTFGLGPHHRR